MKRLIVILVLAVGSSARADTPDAWTAEMQAGRAALTARDFDTAASRYAEALRIAEATPESPSLVIDTLRQLAAVQRISGDLAGARGTLERLIELSKSAGPPALPLAQAHTELAKTLKAMSLFQEAMGQAQTAYRIRNGLLGSDHLDLALDLAYMGMLALDLEQLGFAKTLYRQALGITEAKAGADSPLVLPYLDILGRLARDEAAYEEAEPILSRALVIREAAFGPDDPELLANLDNLAFVLFGAKKYDAAEPLYRRLLAIWETSGGPDHPMVALTADKIQQFYSAQSRYAEAAPYAERALAIRVKAHIESLLRTGRLEIAQSRMPEGEKLYRRALAIADEARPAEDFVLPPLQTLQALLKQTRRTSEAAALDARIKGLLLKKGDREGRRPVPGIKPAAQ